MTTGPTNANGPEGPLRSLFDGVADGTRTHDDQNHNLGLYQLSYSHRRKPRIIARLSDKFAHRTQLVQRLAAEAASAAAAAPAPFTSTLNRFFSAR